jgi:hypothetical protein
MPLIGMALIADALMTGMACTFSRRDMTCVSFDLTLAVDNACLAVLTCTLDTMIGLRLILAMDITPFNVRFTTVFDAILAPYTH